MSTLTDVEYQDLANNTAENVYGLMEFIHSHMPKNPDGTIDIGPVVAGAISAALQWMVKADRSDDDIRNSVIQMVDAMLPQIRFAMVAGEHQGHG